jgi:hypothetical protein
LYDYVTQTPLVDFSGVSLMAYISCYSAETTNSLYNLPRSSVLCGAECAFGFRGQIVCEYASEWTEDFFELLAYYNTRTIYTASVRIGSCESYSSDIKAINSAKGVYGNTNLDLGGYLQ